MTQANEYAFPKSVSGYSGHQGLTKREYFASLALQGLCTEAAWNKNIHTQAESLNTTPSVAIATYAVDLADALIEALNKEGGQS